MCHFQGGTLVRGCKRARARACAAFNFNSLLLCALASFRALCRSLWRRLGMGVTRKAKGLEELLGLMGDTEGAEAVQAVKAGRQSQQRRAMKAKAKKGRTQHRTLRTTEAPQTASEPPARMRSARSDWLG